MSGIMNTSLQDGDDQGVCGPPHEWVTQYKRVLKWSLPCMAIGILLVVAGVTTFAHFKN